MPKVVVDIEGMPKLQKDLKRLGKVPQKHVTSSSRKAMNIVLKQARADAPEGDTGNLKKGIVMKGERARRTKGKKVYRIVFDRALNYAFQKPIQSPGSRGGKGNAMGYYPISQEYGYFAGSGNYIPGFRFISNALTDNVKPIKKIIVSEMQKKIDAEISKAGLD